MKDGCTMWNPHCECIAHVVAELSLSLLNFHILNGFLCCGFLLSLLANFGTISIFPKGKWHGRNIKCVVESFKKMGKVFWTNIHPW